MKYQARNNFLINWPEYPLLRVTICFIVGIVLSDFFAIPIKQNMVVLFGLLAICLFFNCAKTLSRDRIRIVSSIVILLGISLGILRGNLQKNSNNPFHYSNYIEQENLIVGEVITELKKKKRVSTTIEVRSINGCRTKGKLLVYFSANDSLVDYQVSDKIALIGKIQSLRDNANPKAFNYKNFLKYKGIGSQIFLKDGQHELMSKGRSNFLIHTAVQVRKWALSIFEERLPNKDELATASAMVLGDKEHLSKDLYTSFSETGAVHVLAVSGLHVGIICMIFIFFFSRFKSESNSFKIIKLVTLLSVVWLYALVTGASPAVLRASVMFSLLLVGRLWFKSTNIYNILALSALIILLFDPYLLFQLSFQFSYLALISIVFFQPHIEKLYETKHWITTKIWQLTTVSIAAQILIFPISVFYFHKFPTYFILSGVAAVFLATFILGLGLLLLGLNSVPVLGNIIAAGYSKLLEIFIQIIAAIQSLPYNNVDGIYISKESVVLLYVLIGIIMFIMSMKPKNYKDVFQRKSKRKQIAKLMLATCIILLFSNNILFSLRAKNHNELIVYDISKSTAIDIFCENKLHTIESDKIDASKVDFASRSYRIYNGNPEIITLDTIYPAECRNIIFGKNGALIFKNKRIILVDKVNMSEPFLCESDFVFVVNQTEILPYEFLRHHITSKVVLDNSLSFRVKNQWIRECEKRGILVHDIRVDGIFRF